MAGSIAPGLLAIQADRFRDELTATLLGVSDGAINPAGLGRIVAVSAAAAERACAGRAMACGAGCPHCCVLNVAILLPEGMVIAGWLHDHLSDPALRDLCDRLALHRAWVRWMDDEERIIKQAVCPFLDDSGCCMIHPVRPLFCRAVSSLDRSSCREAFNPIVSDRTRVVQADLVRQAAFDQAFLSLAGVLKQQGLDDRSIELGAGVLGFLELPECRELFLSGTPLPDELWQ